jgi:phosphoglucomutase
LVSDHWQKFGRSYFQRHDYEGLDSVVAAEMLDGLRSRMQSFVGGDMAFSKVINADDFCYKDPVDGSVSARQGLRFILEDGSRIIGRLSGTGTEGATLRLYFERYRRDGNEPLEKMLQPLVDEAFKLFLIKEKLNRERPTVIT